MYKNLNAGLLVLACATVVQGCSWVDLETNAEDVLVLKPHQTKQCEEMRKTTSQVVDKVWFVDRNPEKVAKELATLARAEFLEKNKILSLVKVTQSENLISGARALIKNYGIGSVRPNTLIFGDSSKPERVQEFAEIIKTAILYQKNVLVIKKSQESLESFPVPAFIDIWWGGKNNNASLMLTLAYMMIQSKNWKNTKLRLRSMVDSEDERQGVHENLCRFIKSSRIDAQVDIVFEPKLEAPLEKVVRYSKGSDFVFIGMRRPQPEETTEEYAEYYQNILKLTKSLPFVIFGLAGEDIEFHKIFS